MMTNCRRRDEEGEEEEFYESLDRILSCSSSSCSSDNDDGPPGHPIYRTSNSDNPSGSHDGVATPTRSTTVVSSPYDVWMADPAPVHERRQRLLTQFGLASDRILSRLDSDLASPLHHQHLRAHVSEGDIVARRSASCDYLAQHQVTGGTRMTRSNSDGAASGNGAAASPVHCISVNSHCSSVSVAPLPVHPNSIQSDASISSPPDTNHLSSPFNITKQGCCNGSSPALIKSPHDKISHRSDEISSFDPTVNHTQSVDVYDRRILIHDHEACTIKNLDDGKQFVVNEIGEDGVWNNLRELGTGRQLTREEFDRCVVGHSPIVQELMRRQNGEESVSPDKEEAQASRLSASEPKLKKKGNWLKNIKHVASSVAGHNRERRSSDERETSSEKGGRRSSSATDDSQDILFPAHERTKVRHYGKSTKELTALYMGQEIQAHNGSIWTIKFSVDGCYLASAGQDRVIHIWQVVESDRRGDFLGEKLEGGNSNSSLIVNALSEPSFITSNGDSYPERKKRGKISHSRKCMNPDNIFPPENVFALSEKPVCSFQGHLADVLDLSWSKSEFLLSSSMDKTVRLWQMSNKSCLKMFSHSDFVTCIQFNPVDDEYFISGSLDAKVRIWSIRNRQVVDWNDLHEMVTAVCYTPDGQDFSSGTLKGALIGSHKGSCHLYKTSDNKLLLRRAINLQGKKKKSHVKKITGCQFAPGNSSEVLITSADSRIRVVDGIDLVHKFKGFRNTSSQISAGFTSNGKYVVCASEDSHVYIWRYDSDTRPSREKGVNVTRSYEHFHCRDVSVAIPWPGRCQEICSDTEQIGNATGEPPGLAEEVHCQEVCLPAYECASSPLQICTSNSNASCFSERASVTWPEEKLFAPVLEKHHGRFSFSTSSSAWGMVIVTAGLSGEIRIFQNFGLPLQL